MTKLVVHYAPGILAVLKRTFPGRNRHFTIVAVHLLKGDEAAWVLEQSWIPQKAEQRGREQLVH